MVLQLINLIFTALYIIIFAGVLLSWVELAVQRAAWLYSPPVNVVRELSFQIIRPFRNLMDRVGLRTGAIDFSPMLAFFALELLQQLLNQMLSGIGIRY